MNMNVMTALTALAEDTAAVREKLRANPDKVYFPNFGGGDNILKEGISIDRVAFTVPGLNFTVYWYGLLIGIGMLLAIIYGFRKMRPCFHPKSQHFHA